MTSYASLAGRLTEVYERTILFGSSRSSAAGGAGQTGPQAGGCRTLRECSGGFRIPAGGPEPGGCLFRACVRVRPYPDQVCAERHSLGPLSSVRFTRGLQTETALRRVSVSIAGTRGRRLPDGRQGSAEHEGAEAQHLWRRSGSPARGPQRSARTPVAVSPPGFGGDGESGWSRT